MSVTGDSIQNGSSYRLPFRRGERIRLGRHRLSPDPGDEDAVRRWLDARPRPWAIDLFCGAGGLSVGLEDAGFSVVAGADFDRRSTETHAANIQGLTWTGDLADPSEFIQQLDEWGIVDVDLLAGGPPCQPFSRAGTSKIGDLVRTGQRQPVDTRANLWESFFAIADRLSPRAMLFENVPDFASAQGGTLLVTLIDELKNRGYEVNVRELQAWKYRVPQHRSRLFVVGVHSGKRFAWPNPKGMGPTVRQAIGDLPVVPADTREETQDYKGPPVSMLSRLLRRGMEGVEAWRIHDHITRAVRPDDAEIYSQLHPGDTYLDVPEHLRRYRSDSFGDKYSRLAFDGLCRTITAHIAKDGYWYIHPSEDRTLSIREAARIQTFPDRFRFAGHPSSRYRQIGNAVPPLLASEIGTALRSALEDNPGGLITTIDNARCSPSFRENLVQWFRWNRRDFPWRRPGLSPWQVLLVEMCLHRTKADQVAKVADELISLGQTPDSFLNNAGALEPALASLGLFWRAENLCSAAEFIKNQKNGRVPDNWQELITVPGVGDYIASAILCFAFGRPSVLLDTNTLRIARRISGEHLKQSKWQIRLSLHELAGDGGADAEWNQALLDLGALVCKAQAPKCGDCPVRNHCVTGGDNGAR